MVIDVSFSSSTDDERGKFLTEETLVLVRWEVLQDNLVLSIGLIMELTTVKRFES